MRLAVVADIHGNWTALARVIERIHDLKIDAVAGLGDYLWTTTGDAAVVDWIGRTSPGYFVRGNGDTMDYYERCRKLAHEDPRAIYEAVAALPERIELDLEGWRILLQHEWWPGGDPATLGRRLLHPPYVGPDVDLEGIDVAVFGDCHLPLHHALPELLIVHPGSVGAPFDADPTSAKFAVLDVTPERVRLEHHAVPFDIHAANREIIEGRAIDINHSYYRKMTEIRLKVASPNGEYWEPVPAPVEWRKDRQEVRSWQSCRN